LNIVYSVDDVSKIIKKNLNNVVYVYSYKELENKKVFEIEYCEGGV
jgi:hypothetical protein